MRWVVIGGVIFAFFIAPVMFRSCSEAEFDRARNRMHSDMESSRGRPVDPGNNPPPEEENW